MANVKQPVNYNYQYTGGAGKIFVPIDNFVYLYHTETLIAIPTYPESITDSMSASFAVTPILARSAPIYSYSNSGPRDVSVAFSLHRDMMNQVNIEASTLNVSDLSREDYVDILVNQLRASVVPKYAAESKMVNPPIVGVKVGNDIFVKGVVNGAISVEYFGPILKTDRYACVNIAFTVTEVEPYEASTVMVSGGYRGLSADLERNVWRASGGGGTGGSSGLAASGGMRNSSTMRVAL